MGYATAVRTLCDLLAEVLPELVPHIVDLVKSIARSEDPKAAVERARRAVLATSTEHASDESIRRILAAQGD